VKTHWRVVTTLGPDRAERSDNPAVMRQQDVIRVSTEFKDDGREGAMDMFNDQVAALQNSDNGPGQIIHVSLEAIAVQEGLS
jgi:hypothetical protein